MPRMSRPTPRLLARLRHHRGVWVLALAVLLFKVAMSTFCVLDGPGFVLGGDVANAGTTVLVDADDCVLDEGGGCHCSCAHAVALPAGDTSVPVSVAVLSVEAVLTDALSPSFFRSPLRPPIA
jgi:hypothetical protein